MKNLFKKDRKGNIMGFLLADKEIVNKFFNMLSPLKDDEVYFLSLSARNKYLSMEEREKLSLGRTEMFCRKVIQTDNFDSFWRLLVEMEEIAQVSRTRNGSAIPKSALVLYININPSSGKKALQEFYQKTNCMIFGETQPQYHKLQSVLLSCYQRATGTRKFIDIDLDVTVIEKNTEILEAIYQELMTEYAQHEIEVTPIRTNSGYHFLLNKDTIKYNYTGIINVLNYRFFGDSKNGEIQVNNNAMIPLPGTYQAGKEVCFG